MHGTMAMSPAEHSLYGIVISDRERQTRMFARFLCFLLFFENVNLKFS